MSMRFAAAPGVPSCWGLAAGTGHHHALSEWLIPWGPRRRRVVLQRPPVIAGWRQKPSRALRLCCTLVDIVDDVTKPLHKVKRCS